MISGGSAWNSHDCLNCQRFTRFRHYFYLNLKRREFEEHIFCDLLHQLNK